MSDRNKSETVEQRLAAMLKGAFAGTPTQLKDIPKKRGARPKGAKVKKRR